MPEVLRFIADEGVEKTIVLALRVQYDVIYIAEAAQGSNDDFILELAQKENRLLITLDKDFGELVFRLNKAHAGVILCRMQGLTNEDKAALVVTTIDKYHIELLQSFTVIQPKNIRIRKRIDT
ncbi:MAG: hypothetical protein JWP69_1213 [Flaviaesturariibacter sp.]|nr:hypothetical protein [Flaviaesturariibacter sp.]